MLDCSFDLVPVVDDRLEDLDEVAPVVANRVSEARHVLPIPMAATPDDVGRDVLGADDVRV